MGALRSVSRYHQMSGPLYVANCGTNSIAVVNLNQRKPGVIGMLPTAYAPTCVSVSRDGRWLYVVNAKSPAGPNPGNYNGAAWRNQSPGMDR